MASMIWLRRMLRPLCIRGENAGEVELGEALEEAQVLVEDRQPGGDDLAVRCQAGPRPRGR